MKTKYFLTMGILASSLLGTVSHAEIRTIPLSEARPLMKFNELKSADKLLLAEQIRVVLKEIYVNRHVKNQQYGVSPTFNGHKDAVAEIESIVANVHKMSTEELHKNLSRLFVNQRDLHLKYQMPAPYGSFFSFLPIDLVSTVSKNGSTEIRIKTIYPDYFKDFATNERVPEKGDLVLEYGGEPIEKVVQKNIAYANGANQHAGHAQALAMLTDIHQKNMLAPTNDKVNLKLRSAKTGEIYSVTLPWVSMFDTNSLTPNSTFSATAMGENNNEHIVSKVQDTPYKAQLKETSEASSPNGFIRYQIPSQGLEVGILNKGDKKVGYLKIKTFQVNSIQNTLDNISYLLRNYLSTTDALIIDVRDNPGGQIIYSELLPSMFTPKEAPQTLFRALNSDVSKQIRDAFRVTPIDDLPNSPNYTKFFVFLDRASINYFDYGQHYYKPVGIFMNAKTYSAADMFTCQMQDIGAATIFGEHPTTGAGGANVLDYSWMQSRIPQYFKPLPGGASLRVSYAQVVRTGYNKGALIEDQGCKANVQVPTTLDDLLNDGQNQFDKIATALLSKPQPNGQLSFPVTNQNIQISTSTSEIPIGVKNTEFVKVYINGQLHTDRRVGIYGAMKQISIELPKYPKGTFYQLKIVGTDTVGTPIWNTKRNVSLN